VPAGGRALRRGRVLHALAQVHFELGDHERALDLVHQALRVHRETGHRLGEARSLRLFADLVARLHGTDAAAGHGAEADALFAATGATPV
jgi:hypothetical protein